MGIIITGSKPIYALSPTLLNIFINDLSNELNSLNLGVQIGDALLCHLLYADDLTLIATIKLIFNYC